MTDAQAVRGNGLMSATTTMATISWFEFILDGSLLTNHLQKDNPGEVFFIAHFRCKGRGGMAVIVQNGEWVKGEMK